MTLNVLIVDDEPLIRKGLTTMIDWSLYGFSVMGEFSNGEDALAYLSENPNQVDVILTDIRMPGMDGLELIKRVKEIATKEIYFVILSGYYEFEYAKKAIQYQVKDYLLKPIQADDLIEILKKINVDYMQQVKEEIEVNTRKKALLDRSFSRLLLNNYSSEDIGLIEAHYQTIATILSVIMTITVIENMDTEEKSIFYKGLKQSVHPHIQELIQTYYPASYVSPSFQKKGDTYSINLLIINHNEKVQATLVDISNQLLALMPHGFHQMQLAVGSVEKQLNNVAQSYQSALLVKEYNRYFSSSYFINNFESLPEFSMETSLLSPSLNARYLKSIKNHDEETLALVVKEIYRLFQTRQLHPELINRHLLFFTHKLTTVFSEINDKNEAEFMFLNYIDEKMTSDVMREENFLTVSLEIARYISRIKQSSSSDILLNIKEEIEEHYMEKLTLKEFGEKYHINNVYLGQLFRKHFGMQFIDFLNHYRIKKACEQLIETEERIYRIAENVGFQSPDYFIKKFLQLMGTTPGKYRMENS